MRITIVSIGSELLIGHALNTNLAFIGRQLAEAGYTIGREVCIPDDPGIMADTFRQELSSAELVITIGGLGPTRDDLTRKVAARVLGVKLLEQAAVRTHIEQYLGARRRLIPDHAVRVQSQIPAGATALLNHNGTAPGLWCPKGRRNLVLLPGPPAELGPIFDQQVMPRIARLGRPESCRRSLRLYSIPESTAAEKLESSILFPRQVEVAYCARSGELDIRLTAPPEMADQLDQLIDQARVLFGQAALPPNLDLAQVIGELLNAREWRLAVAESCTGGLLGARLTKRPGASSFFTGGLICYDNQVKSGLLNVPARILQDEGAVSPDCARALAAGVQQRLASETSIAVTGIAGPAGGTVEKPVGLVYIATAVQQEIRVQARNFNGNRENIRNRAVTAALDDFRIHLSTSGQS